jgi:FAD/FMN-containing dehydrogenase
MDPVLRALRDAVGVAHVLTAPEDVAGHVVDWTGRFRGATPAVVRPGSTEEVAAVIAVAREHGLALVPQGGNTGLVGGGVPLHDEVVVSLTRLDAIGAVDPAAAQVTAGAGATVAAVQAAAATGGLRYAVDLAARDTATVGGTIATNAGGLNLLRYGGTREQLVGVEAVLGDGSIVSHLGGLLKDNTGYHLPSLLCGSEGTLAIVTAARLRLVPAHDARVVALVGFGSVAEAVAAVAGWRRSVRSLEAAELFLAAGLELVCRTFDRPRPLAGDWPAYVLVEAAADADPTDELAAAVAATPGAGDAAVASEAARRQELWRYREDHTLAIGSLGAPHKLDVTLPPGALADFVERVPGLVDGIEPGATTWLFGHVGDGNVHVNVTGVAPDDERIDDAVLRLVASLGGSISAEHGIGTAKRRWLALARSPAELAAMRSIKAALDPDGILNPNVLLP